MAPVLFRKLPWGTKAIHPKLFGDHKTWRGIVAAVLVGGVVFLLQKTLYASGWHMFALIDYNDFGFSLGFLLGLGAIMGDLVKSYYKRKADIAPGVSWIPFDQIDFVIGGIVLACIVFVPPAEVALVLLLVSPILHITTNYVGFLLKINKNRL